MTASIVRIRICQLLMFAIYRLMSLDDGFDKAKDSRLAPYQKLKHCRKCPRGESIPVFDGDLKITWPEPCILNAPGC